MSILIKITQKPFFKNVLWVAGGTASAQAVAMLFAPVITRLYQPEAFGVLGTFQSLIMMLLPLASLALPLAIVLPKENANARQLVRLSMYAAGLVSVLVAVLLAGLREPLLDLLNMQALGNFVWLIPLALLFYGIAETQKQWLIRAQQFKALAKANITQSLLINSAKVGIGIWFPLAITLVSLNAVMHAVQSACVLLFYKKPAKTDSTKPDSMRKLLRYYRNIPLFRAPQLLLNAATQGAPLLFLAAFFGPATAGFFTLSKTVMMIPSTLLGKSINDVFVARIAKAKHNQEPLDRLFNKATLLMAATGIIPYSVVIAFGPTLFGWVFGDNWSMAGEFARWMAIMLFFAFINRPTAAILNVLERHKTFLVYELLSLVIRLVVIALTYIMTHDALLTIIAFSAIGSLLNLMLLAYTAAIVRAHSTSGNDYESV